VARVYHMGQHGIRIKAQWRQVFLSVEWIHEWINVLLAAHSNEYSTEYILKQQNT
jgi:hypothetical protein